MKTNKPSSIPPFHCCSVLEPQRSPCFSPTTDDGREGRTAAEQREGRGGKNGKDLFIEGRRRSGGGRGGASEFLIIVTATSHLATGYTIAAVALATAWSPPEPPERRRMMWQRAARETGRQMERRGEERKMEGRTG